MNMSYIYTHRILHKNCIEIIYLHPLEKITCHNYSFNLHRAVSGRSTGYCFIIWWSPGQAIR